MFNRRELLQLVPVGGLAVVGLAACSDSAGGGSGGTGSVIWYTDHDAQEVQGVISAFTEETGIAIELFTSTSAGVVSKATAEVNSGAKSADVITVSGPLSYEGLLEANVPADLPESVVSLVPEQDAAFTSTDGKWFSAYTTLVGIAYNTDQVDEAHVPTDFQSFLDPYWQGKFSIPVSTNSTSVQSYYQMVQAPSLGEDFIVALGENDPVILEKSGQQVSDLITGNQLGAIVNDDAVWPQISNGAPLAYVYPPEGMAAIHDYNLLVEGAANPDGAEQFLQFLAGETALKALAAGGSTVTVPGIELTPPERPTVADLTFFPPVDSAELLAAQDEMVPFLSDAFNE